MDPAVEALSRQPKTKPRILMLTIRVLGWSTYAANLQAGLSHESDVDIAHVLLGAPLPQKVLGRTYPGEIGWLNGAVRRRLLWRMHLPALLRMIRVGQFDAIHATTEEAGLLVTAAKRATGTPFSLGVDSTATLDQDGPWRASERRGFAILDRFDRRSLSAAEFVAPLSEWAGHSLREDYGVRSVMVTPPSIDVRSSSVRAPHPGRPCQIVFIGNDWQRKGGERLVAWHQEHLHNTVLHIISRSAPALDGLPGVIRHGSVPRERVLHELLPQMDVLALPTSFDMSPWVLVEAAAAGLPCVASRLAGIPEVVHDGETGTLCAAGDDDGFVDALRHLADHPETVNDYGRRARALALAAFDARTTYRPIIDRLLAATSA